MPPTGRFVLGCTGLGAALAILAIFGAVWGLATLGFPCTGALCP